MLSTDEMACLCVQVAIWRSLTVIGLPQLLSETCHDLSHRMTVIGNAETLGATSLIP